MNHKSSKNSSKQTRKKTSAVSHDTEDDNRKILLNIKRELNITLKDMFEDHGERLTKLESFFFSKDDQSKDYPKAPEYCYT